MRVFETSKLSCIEQLLQSLPLSNVAQRRMFSVCVKEMRRPGPVLYCLYPDPSTPMEQMMLSPGGKE